MHEDIKPFNVFQFAIKPKDKELHREKIAIRFKDMIDMGLIKEVEEILNIKQMSADKPSMNTVGYKEDSDYLNGDLSFDEMIARGIIATRQLAKRQMTWLRSWNKIIWLEEDSVNNLKIILDSIKK